MPGEDDKRNFNRLDLIMGFEGTHSGGIPNQSFWSIKKDDQENWGLVPNIPMKPEEILLVLDQIMARIAEARNRLALKEPVPTAITLHSFLTTVTLIAESKDAALRDVEQTFKGTDLLVRKDMPVLELQSKPLGASQFVVFVEQRANSTGSPSGST